MESLLANYGSDDEEDERQNGDPRKLLQQPARAPLSASLPPPRVEHDRSSDLLSHRSFLFASLPRPKLANEQTWMSESRDTGYRNDANAFNAADERKEPENSFEIGMKTDRNSDLGKQGNNLQNAAMQPRSRTVNETSSSKVSLFSALPPPRNAGASAAPLTSQASSGLSSKRVVEIRPSINWALLRESANDDDDDVERRAKKLATDVKLTGLAAILPKPKNLGSALGSGNVMGHQTTLDVETSAAPQATEFDSTLLRGNSFDHQHTLLDVGDSGAAMSSNTQDTSSFMSVPLLMDESLRGSWDAHTVGTDLHTQSGSLQLSSVSSSHLTATTQEAADVHYPENYYSSSDMYSQEMVGHEMTAQDALAEMLLRDKRKGGRNAPVNIIEVKQADLTATKLREDQLRTTGIAFGPAYKPVSTGKSKPSKLHRRKHQIGSLYYDMKQKETELMERRAKGSMTKAETQAKYGW